MKLKYIDALRGIAIFLVMMLHASQYGSNEYSDIFKMLFGSGEKGVQLFYLASAFTLFLSYYNRADKEKNVVTNFFLRRFFRIAPMYYIGIIYYLWQDGFGPRYFLGDQDHITSGNIISNFLFIHGVNPYWINSVVPGGWSISVEMTFYAIVPILVIWLTTFNRAVFFTVIATIGSLILYLFLLHHPLIDHNQLWREYLYFYFPNQLPVFGLGVAAFFLIAKKDHMLSPLTLLLLALIFIAQFIWGFIINKVVLFGFGFFLLMLALSRWETKFLVNTFTINLGKVSYSSYLVHFAVLHWMAHFGWVDFIEAQGTFPSLLNYAIRLLIVVVVTMSISTVFYNFIEQPFQKVGKRIITFGEKKAIAAA